MPPFVREAAVVAGGASAEPFALEADRMLSSVPSNDQRYLPGKGMRPRTEPLPAAQFDWIVGSVLLITPFIAIWGIINVPLQTPTLIYTVLLYFASGLGITAGYHRLWSHKAYDAAWPLELFLALSGAAAMEGSGRWWCRNHRAHHKFTDTPKDPYNVRRSLLWAHIGWMLVKQNKNEVGYADITDLDENKILQWQHRNYPLLVLLCGVAVPWLTAGLLWGDWWGGYFYCVILRLVFIHHSTFFVNSLAHYLGNQPYSDMHTAFDSFITAVLSLGEGYHNYHHEFPQDYRNGIKWYHYDPTKWFIVACSYVGLAYNLKFIPKNEIDKAKLQMSQNALDEHKALLEFGKTLSKDLPVFTRQQVRTEAASGRSLVIVSNRVYDASKFVDVHPGGRQTLLKHVGEDVTPLFRGDTGEHIHSKFAIATLKRMLVGQVAQE